MEQSYISRTSGIGKKDKIGYAMGDVGSLLVFGLVQSVLQKYYTDILGIGVVSIMLMFVLLLWRFMMIADNADDFYGAMLVVGVISHISVQVILNIAVVTNMIPNTGVTLPFFSYGGSSVFFLLSEIGIVLSVARGMSRDELAKYGE